jgi:heme/copper-type cytochrome/quinol oxidase subunit 4
MPNLIRWLAAHRSWNILLLAGYFLAVVLPHKRFGSFLNDRVFSGVSRATYNWIILVLAVAVLIGALLFFWQKTRALPNRNKLRFYLLSTIVLAALVIGMLFVINIEMIHFPQYAIFAILVFPLTGCYRDAMLWTLLAGTLDEAFQYFYLAPQDTTYFDFNDVITNLVGSAFGLILLKSFDLQERVRKRFGSPAIIAWGVLGMLLLVLVATGYLSVYPSEEAPWQLVRAFPEDFWSTVPLGFTYHVVSPGEGVVVVFLLLLFYNPLWR